MVEMVPFGYHGERQMHVRIDCRECYIPLVSAPILESREERVEEQLGDAEIQRRGENWNEETVVETNGDIGRW
jgi:hypothetical protein